MFTADGIEGIEVLRTKIPTELQSWGEFGCHIDDLHFFSDISEYGVDIKCLNIILSDREKRYRINLHFNNVSGKISFEPINGFCSGLSIDNLSSRGYEKTKRFHIYSFEMDNDTDFYCEKVKAELV